MVSFRHVGIVVHNLEEQLTFYRDFLGLEEYYNKTEEGQFLEDILNIKSISAKIIKLGKNKKILIELLKFNYDGEKYTSSIINFGYTHIALTVKNLTKIYKSNSSTFISKPKINNEGTHMVCFCKDPENNILELVEELK